MPPSPDQRVRPPRQERTRIAWERVLDAGLALLEDGGYEAFTIAAVCERAGVSPPAIYARVDGKEALFSAVYERGMRDIRDEEAVFGGHEWDGVGPDEVVRRAVGVIGHSFIAHSRFLRAVVLRSAADPELSARGAANRAELAGLFRSLVLRHRESIRGADPAAEIDACFRLVFSALVVHVAYGTALEPTGPDDAGVLAQLEEAAVRMLLHPHG